MISLESIVQFKYLQCNEFFTVNHSLLPIHQFSFDWYFFQLCKISFPCLIYLLVIQSSASLAQNFFYYQLFPGFSLNSKRKSERNDIYSHFMLWYALSMVILNITKIKRQKTSEIVNFKIIIEIAIWRKNDENNWLFITGWD